MFENSKNTYEREENSILPLDENLQIPSIFADCAVMEKTKNIKAVKAKFQWSDIGSFESVYDYLIKNGHPVDDNGNMVIGFKIYTEFLGLRKCILVITCDAMLVIKKEIAQDVKKIYENLNNLIINSINSEN